jgi:hypothetical protein
MKVTVPRWLRAAFPIAAILVGAVGIAIGGGGATGTGFIAQGRLSAFGSIFVNGVEFFTDKAAITINGVPNRSESDLKLGMVLDVYGSIDGSGKTGTAQTVDYHANALGLVDSAPVATADGASFDVLGQTIYTDAYTVFANALGPQDIHVGDYVEVSGFPSPSGVLASRVERKTSVPKVQVQGVLANLAGSTFTLGALSVDDSIATFKNVPAGGLANGQTVVVNGPAPQPDGVLQATSVEVIDTSVSGSTNGSVSGVIAAAASSSIVVNGQAFALTSSTQLVNGSAAGLAEGVLVKVDFTVIGGTVFASRIEFVQLSEATSVEANVTSVGDGYVELLGPGGVRVTANSATQFRDGSSAKLGGGLTLADIAPGDHLQVVGNQVNATTVLATRLVRRNPSSTIVVEGHAGSASAPSFTVVDLDFAVTPSTLLVDERGNVLSADTFFAKVAGHDVAVSAALQGGALVATSVRLDY